MGRGRLLAMLFSFGLTASTVACRSSFLPIAPALPDHYVETGTGSGSACGVVLVAIPIRVNNRILRAYDQALQRAGTTWRRADGLTNTTVTDSWTWTPFGVFLCTKITGTGISEER